jgi:Tfp pilus assembly protein PilN
MRAVNLLPPELRSESRRGAKAPGADAVGGSGPLVVLGALALCLLAVAAYVLAGNTVTERRSELAQVTATHELVARQAAALKPYGDFQDMAIKRRETVASLASLRFDWEQALRDVSHALPGGVTLSALDGSISTDTGNGGQTRGAIPSPAITLKGCTVNQARVATILSRLRGVRGVTRVSLAKSERKPGGQSAGGAPAPCGDGAPPEFEVVAFFERSIAATVPADAGAGADAAVSVTGGDTGAAQTPAGGSSPDATATSTPSAVPTP